MWSLFLLDSSLCTWKSNLFLLDSSLCTRKSTSFWLLRLQFWWGGRKAAKWHKDHMITRKPTDTNQWKHANQVCVASQGTKHKLMHFAFCLDLGIFFGTKLPNKQQNPHPDLSYNMVTVLFSAFVKFLCLFSLKMRQPCY